MREFQTQIKRKRFTKGFTLVELLIAVALLSLLGTMLITTLRTSVSISRRGQERGEAFIKAQALFARFEEDVSQLQGGESGRLIAGQDPMGRFFMAFIRNFPEERKSLGGYYSGQEAPEKGYDQYWRGKAADGYFRALGGSAEICYVMEPVLDSQRLYRGIFAPVGGKESSVRVSNPGAPIEAGVIQDMEDWHLQAASARPAAAASILRQDFHFYDHYQLLADQVLFFGCEFWAENTQRWESLGSSPSPFLSSSQTPNDGPLYHWESSPSSLLYSQLDQSWPRRPSDYVSAPHRDMSYPQALRLTLIIAEEGQFAQRSTSIEPFSEQATSLRVEDASSFIESQTGKGFLRIGDEIIEYRERQGDFFRGIQRGVGGSLAQAHPFGTEVRAGIRFQRIFHIPAGR